MGISIFNDWQQSFWISACFNWTIAKQRTTDDFPPTPTSQWPLDDRDSREFDSTRSTAKNIRGNSDCSFETNPSVLLFQFELYPNLPLVKSGYPPRALAIVPELPFDSLGLRRGDQIIVSEVPNTDAHIPPQQGPPTLSPSGPDHVQVDAGFLIHRVKIRSIT